MKEEGISNKTIIRNYLFMFIIPAILTILVMLVYFKKMYWNYLLIIAGIWSFFVGGLGVLTYFYKKSHPELSKSLNQPEIKKSSNILTFLLGFIFIIGAIYNFVFGTKERALVMGGFGFLILVWGIIDYFGQKKKKRE